jgi:single-strand DNA-binding protein
LLERLRVETQCTVDRPPLRTQHTQPQALVLPDADLNRVHLTGILGSVPMLYTSGDHPVAALSLRCTERWQTPDGRLKSETAWYNLTAWEELAEHCGRSVHPGDRVYVEGRLHLTPTVHGSHSFTTLTIIVDRIVILDVALPRSS